MPEISVTLSDTRVQMRREKFITKIDINYKLRVSHRDTSLHAKYTILLTYSKALSQIQRKWEKISLWQRMQTSVECFPVFWHHWTQQNSTRPTGVQYSNLKITAKKCNINQKKEGEGEQKNKRLQCDYTRRLKGATAASGLWPRSEDDSILSVFCLYPPTSYS